MRGFIFTLGFIFLGILHSACGDITVSTPYAGVTCEQTLCRSGQQCINGVCTDEQADVGQVRADAGTSDRDSGPVLNDAGTVTSDAGPSPADAGTVTSDAGPSPADAGTPQPGGDGSRRDRAALSCQELLRNFPDRDSASYYIDPDGANGPIEPFEVFCGMEYDDGGWTQVARLLYRDEVWDAWNDTEGQPGASRGSWGVPLKWFANDDDGRDLEILIGVAVQRRDYYIGPSYSDVPSAAWQPGVSIEASFGDGFDSRTDGNNFERCNAEIWRRNARWSWAISRGEEGCAGWAGGSGFVIYGSERSPRDAYSVWGLNAYGRNNRGSSFEAVDLFVRQR